MACSMNYRRKLPLVVAAAAVAESAEESAEESVEESAKESKGTGRLDDERACGESLSIRVAR